MVPGNRPARKARARRRVAGPSSGLACGTGVTWPGCIARGTFHAGSAEPRTAIGSAGYGRRRAGPAAPTHKMSMTVIALVLAANLLLAGLFSLVAFAVD